MKKITLLLVFLLPSFALERVGVVVKVKGKVKLFRSLKATKLKGGESLYLGDRVRTYKGLAFIKIFKNKVVLTENSLLVVDRDKVYVKEGRVYFRVFKGKDFKVISRNVAIGIKGTDFMVYRRGGRFILYVKRGSVIAQILREGEEFKRELEEELKELEESKREFEEELRETAREVLRSLRVEEGVALTIVDGTFKKIKIPKRFIEDFKLLDEF